jgi:hypothetical protein
VVYIPPNPVEVEIEVEEPKVHYRTFDLNGVTLQLLGFAVDMFGWALENPSGSVAAKIDIYDSPDGTGVPVFPLALATSAMDIKWFGPNGIRMNNAVYANVTAGEVKGSLFYKHVRR